MKRILAFLATIGLVVTATAFLTVAWILDLPRIISRKFKK